MDLRVFRPSSGVWYLQQSTAGFSALPFGTNEDRPAEADFDGDGKTDVSVFRPSTGIWYLNRSRAGFTALQFGQTGTWPVCPNWRAVKETGTNLIVGSNLMVGSI